MQQKLSLADLPLNNKKILMRVDFNVPLDKNGKITDDTRIAASVPAIRYVLDHGGTLILMSHLGRPKNKWVPELSLTPCARHLSTLLRHPVAMASDCIGPEVEKKVRELKKGDVLLLENLRFHKGEEHPESDPSFVQNLAKLGDFYVNDAFGSAHRPHASTVAIAHYFPGKAAAGFLIEKEIEFLGEALLKPERPFYAIIGGAKISTKIGVLKTLLDKVDALLIGGGMAYTFYKAQGIAIGNSIHEDDLMSTALQLIEIAKQKGVKLFLPIDNVAAEQPLNGSKTRIIVVEEGIPPGFQGVDIGPKTVQLFANELKNAATIFWNGPLGVFEQSEFAKGTIAIAKVISEFNAVKVVGGGDSIAAVQKAGVADLMTHLSTGGGASLEYVEFGTLPGIDALSDKK